VRRLGVLAAALALAVLALGVAVMLLTAPWYTHTLSARFSLAEEAGISRDQALAIAEDVRAFVVAGRGALPDTVAGRPGFDAAAVSHLADVRDVLAGARLATGVLAIVLTGLATWALSSGRRELVGGCLKAGAVATAVLVGLAGFAAVSDFDTFFSAFHGLFFAEGTWTFAYDSLLIRLFPEPFWSTSGASWAGIALAVALGYWGVGAWLVRGERASRA